MSSSASRAAAARGWQEVGAGVYRRRYRSLDLNVGAVLGGDQVLVVDTRSCQTEAAELHDDLRALTALPCRQVVNTHAHFDHCFGNAAFRPAAIWGHRRCAAVLRDQGERERASAMRLLPHAAQRLAELEIVPPGRLVSERATIDLGWRRVELVHPGPGHTDNDLLVLVPDAGVAFAGDLVEQGAPPAFEDAWPLRWPSALDRLVEVAPAVVVPGHGDVPAEDAARLAPFPAATARTAIERALVTAGLSS